MELFMIGQCRMLGLLTRIGGLMHRVVGLIHIVCAGEGVEPLNIKKVENCIRKHTRNIRL